jgi:N-acetylglucosaminyldiphosphoundecaprenol N-acetyl-beta-D-mannosaminyltransferase
MSAPGPTDPESVEVLGVRVTDLTMSAAVERIEALLRHEEPRTRTVFFVNAHTLNLATEDPAYRECLRTADVLFGDGTGVRWAARMRGRRLRDNVNGTDLCPPFEVRGRGSATSCWAVPRR